MVRSPSPSSERRLGTEQRMEPVIQGASILLCRSAVHKFCLGLFCGCWEAQERKGLGWLPGGWGQVVFQGDDGEWRCLMCLWQSLAPHAWGVVGPATVTGTVETACSHARCEHVARGGLGTKRPEPRRMLGDSGQRFATATVFLPMALPQGLDKGTRSVGKAKTRFRKAPKSDNVYVKLLVKVTRQHRTDPLPDAGPSR
jgi:hypothetical protein